jgi:hypothetical protein
MMMMMMIVVVMVMVVVDNMYNNDVFNLPTILPADDDDVDPESSPISSDFIVRTPGTLLPIL